MQHSILHMRKSRIQYKIPHNYPVLTVFSNLRLIILMCKSSTIKEKKKLEVHHLKENFTRKEKKAWCLYYNIPAKSQSCICLVSLPCSRKETAMFISLSSQWVKPLGCRVESIWNINAEAPGIQDRGGQSDACHSFCGGYVTETQQDDIFKPSWRGRNKHHIPRSPQSSPSAD